MDKLDDQYLGRFVINRRSLPGVVKLKGMESRLEVFADRFIHLPQDKMRAIHGVARNGAKLTICDAVGAETSGSSVYHDTTRHYMSLFPNYVAIGSRYLDAHKKTIAGLSFTTSGALDLFYDIGAFGSAASNQIKDVRKIMPAWARKDRRNIVHSEVFYYVARGPIVAVDAGDISIGVFNGPTIHSPSPHGINVTNQVRIDLTFARPVNLQNALKAANEFRSFCEVVAQNRQCIRDVAVRQKNAQQHEAPIRLYVSHAEMEEGPHVRYWDHLVSGGLDKREFETVLARWMATQADHGSARWRAVECVRCGNHYTIDRVVGAANAFDLLPASAVGRPKLPASVVKTLSELANEAGNLPEPYRELATNSLGRVKASNLRQKITARFKSLPNGLRSRFQEMELVIDHAVRTRNYFVHGSKPKLSVNDTYNFIVFLTDTLEFIFVAAELHACGWKYARWLKAAGMGRLREYVRSYDRFLSELKEASP